MSKFYIPDDCNFSVPYFLHLKSIFGENFWVGFQERNETIAMLSLAFLHVII